MKGKRRKKKACKGHSGRGIGKKLLNGRKRILKAMFNRSLAGKAVKLARKGGSLNRAGGSLNRAGGSLNRAGGGLRRAGSSQRGGIAMIPLAIAGAKALGGFLAGKAGDAAFGGIKKAIARGKRRRACRKACRAKGGKRRACRKKCKATVS